MIVGGWIGRVGSWKCLIRWLLSADNEGNSGGLALFWRKRLEVGVKSFLEYHIDSVKE
jgi:hypothetical protein